MASSNTLKNAILELFPDNNNKEISAADMRAFVNTIFDNKEELVVKIIMKSELKANKSKIFEGSIVLITADGDDTGVYVSKANNPISILQLERVADLANGSISPSTPISDFMIEYTHQKNYLNAEYIYSGKNIIQTLLKDETVNIYSVDYLYTGNNISQTSITEIGTSKTVYINFSYTNNNITDKIYIII